MAGCVPIVIGLSDVSTIFLKFPLKSVKGSEQVHTSGRRRDNWDITFEIGNIVACCLTQDSVRMRGAKSWRESDNEWTVRASHAFL